MLSSNRPLMRIVTPVSVILRKPHSLGVATRRRMPRCLFTRRFRKRISNSEPWLAPGLPLPECCRFFY
jgi:hypothetical protein